MNQQNLLVLFYLNKSKINKKGTCPIKCRITYKKRRKEFSVGEFVNPIEWNAKKQRAISKSIENQQLNTQLQIIAANIKKEYLKLQLSEIEFTIEDVFQHYLGKPTLQDTYLIAYFKEFLQKKKKLIGIDIELATWKKYYYACLQAQSFIKWKYKKKDIPLQELKPHFLDDLEFYLKTELSQRQVTVNKTIQRFRKPIRTAVAEGYLDKDPFALHKPGRVIKGVIFLTVEELERLQNYPLEQPRLKLVRDLFIFCCYTGLAYHEMKHLKHEHIIKGFDGNEWIQMERKKTGKKISVPLLPKAKDILNEYDTQQEFILPVISNQKINSYLKEIGAIVSIKKKISHHMARKTFASTVLLYNDVPMEVVSELLGHSSIKITQEYYGRIVQKRVSDEMKRIAKLSS
ncbi:site-specific integrase [Muriicola soli]|uniref:Site-specific integrase n=1 Tax=Muriicola soli TaxID=2507538 RepID=A0A411E7I4_9FLAO|nr:site-specific integrase [Muriicola soli]QBA63675.1 site-specific integrase [Muriicola soli]